MATKKQKSFDAELDDLLSVLDLPSDDDIKHETHKEKNSQAKKLFYQTDAGQKHKELVSKNTKSPENIARLRKQNREERGVPCIFISPVGIEHKFQSAGEASEFFNANVSIHIPKKGAKRIQRRDFKNWIVIRADGSASIEDIDKLKLEVKLKLSPLKKERDVSAWVEKMEAWRNSKEGKKQKKNQQTVAKTMGKKNAKAIMTPDGKFESQAEAAKFYGIGTAAMSQRLRDQSDKYWKI